MGLEDNKYVAGFGGNSEIQKPTFSSCNYNLLKYWAELKSYQCAKRIVENTGLRSTFEGELYLNKTVFFNRPDVLEVIAGMPNIH